MPSIPCQTYISEIIFQKNIHNNLRKYLRVNIFITWYKKYAEIWLIITWPCCNATYKIDGENYGEGYKLKFIY